MLSALLRTAFALFTFLVVLAPPAAAGAGLRESYGRLPLHFEENRGQAHKNVRFLARGPGYGLYLTAGEAVLALGAKDRTVLRMELVGANADAQASGLEELPGKANYFVGKDPAKWRTNVPTYAKVRYREVYPGIDLVYYGNQRQLEYDFVVAPGADPEKIVLGFKGAESLEVDARGELVLHATGGDIRQKKPVIYQEIDGTRREIAGTYVLKPGMRAGFQVELYDRSRPLVIDPVVLSYATYLGGSESDGGSGIALDAEGNAFVAGYTGSIDFPATTGALQPMPRGNWDVFVTKLNSDGSELIYSTFLGGSGSDAGAAIAVDAAGSAFVTGSTVSNDFPTTPGFQPVSGSVGISDAFVVKLDAAGAGLVYSSYLGGSASDGGRSIAVDAHGNAYVTGWTSSINFPATPGAFQQTIAGEADAFIAKVDPSGAALAYSTYLGGMASPDEQGAGIAVDAGGNAHVTGQTTSPSFPTTAGSFQPVYGGGLAYGDAFVAKLNPAGSALVYATYLGGDQSDAGRAIAMDTQGNAYVTGTTASGNFPTTPGAFQTTFGGLDPNFGFGDAFVTKLDPSGSALAYSTFLGGNRADYGLGIAVNALGHAHVTGWTTSINFPTLPSAVQATPGSMFVTKLNAAGAAPVYSTYLGRGLGGSHESSHGIAVGGDGSTYVAGRAIDNFPTTGSAFQPVYAGSGDAFVVKIVDLLPLPDTAVGTR